MVTSDQEEQLRPVAVASDGGDSWRSRRMVGLADCLEKTGEVWLLLLELKADRLIERGKRKKKSREAFIPRSSSSSYSVFHTLIPPWPRDRLQRGRLEESNAW